MKQIESRKLRQLPPALIGILVVTWLLLSQSFTIGSFVLGIVLAVALTWASATLRPVRPHLRRPLAIVGLMFHVLIDIVRSNVAVARIVLGLVRDRDVHSAFAQIPLELRDPHALAFLAAIVTATPGTVWVDLSPDGKVLTLHVLDLRDEEGLRRWIKTRYEKPLMRIFE
jgi:multicomponent K+:H+ antiporter subunit E